LPSVIIASLAFRGLPPPLRLLLYSKHIYHINPTC
jgi:hypothetical protein